MKKPQGTALCCGQPIFKARSLRNRLCSTLILIGFVVSIHLGNGAQESDLWGYLLFFQIVKIVIDWSSFGFEIKTEYECFAQRCYELRK